MQTFSYSFRIQTVCGCYKHSPWFFCVGFVLLCNPRVKGKKAGSETSQSLTSSLRNKHKITQLKLWMNLSQPHNLSNIESPCLLFELKELNNVLTQTVLLKFRYPTLLHHLHSFTELSMLLYFNNCFFVTSLNKTFTVKQSNCTVHILACNATPFSDITV